jgi:hypothetical protein
MKTELFKIFLSLVVILVATSGYAQTENAVTLESLLNKMIDREGTSTFSRIKFPAKDASKNLFNG